MAAGYKHRQQIRLGFYCSEKLAEVVEAVAKAKGLAMTELIRQAVEAYLEQQG